MALGGYAALGKQRFESRHDLTVDRFRKMTECLGDSADRLFIDGAWSAAFRKAIPMNYVMAQTNKPQHLLRDLNIDSEGLTTEGLYIG